jgi:hypothetical protein
MSWGVDLSRLCRAIPSHYSRWYCCINPACKTKLIMPEEYKVYRAPADVEAMRRLDAIKEQRQ